MTVMMMTSLLLQARNENQVLNLLITTSHEKSNDDVEDNDYKDNDDDF
jgi:hypothetical protein